MPSNATAKRLHDLAAAQRRREMEALRLFRPMETQMPFLESEATERVIRGGNRCLGWMQPVYDPVDKTSTPVCERTQPFHVLSVNPQTGRQEVKRAGVPFRKGSADLYRVHLSNGESFVATLAHAVLSSSGWQQLSAHRQGCGGDLPVSSSGTCLPAFPLDVPRWMKTAQDSLGDCHRASHLSGGQPLQAQGIGQGVAPLPSDAPALCVADWREGGRAYTPARSRLCLSSFRLSSRSAFLQTGLHVAASSSQAAWISCASACTTGHTCPQAAAVSTRSPRREAAPLLEEFCTFRAAVASRYPVSLGGVARSLCCTRSPSILGCTQDLGHTAQSSCRHHTSIPSGTSGSESSNSTLSITATAYIGKGDFYDFEVEGNHNYVLGGIVHHNSGKTTIAAAEVASAATGIPLFSADGVEMPFRYPTNKKPMTIWCVGYNQKHIARIYKYLFTPGIFAKFRILCDPVTGQWRAWRPWEEEDAKLEHLTQPHPPMIPRRFCPIDSPPSEKSAGIAYENKGERIFSLAKLTNGTEIYAFSSGGHAGMGVAVDLIWIDEDVEYPQHVAEWQARLSDVKGKMIWSAWPWSDNDALALMSQRAANEEDSEKPDVSEIVLKFSKNPYMPKDEVRKRQKAWAAEGDSTLKARDAGEFLTGLTLVFPSFDIDLHGIPCMLREDDPLDRILAGYHYRIPDDWTHYLSVDPGFGHMAITLSAVPPPHVGDYIIVYDEIYLEKAIPSDAVRELKRKAPDRQWHSFVMDMRMGRQTQTAGKTVKQQWTEEFVAAGIKSRLTYSDFQWGTDNIFARNMLVRRALDVRSDRTTKLRLFRETTPHMQREFSKYRRTVTRDEITDKVRDSHNHLMDANGYLFGSDPVYYAPRPEERDPGRAMKAMKAIQNRNRKPTDDTIFLGAGPAPAIPSF